MGALFDKGIITQEEHINKIKSFIEDTTETSIHLELNKLSEIIDTWVAEKIHGELPRELSVTKAEFQKHYLLYCEEFNAKLKVRADEITEILKTFYQNGSIRSLHQSNNKHNTRTIFDRRGY